MEEKKRGEGGRTGEMEELKNDKKEEEGERR